MTRTSNIENYLTSLKIFYFKYGFIPNFDTLTNLFGLNSKGAIFKIFVQLAEMGFIEKKGNKFYPTRKFTAIPMFESIRAGFPSQQDTDSGIDINLEQHLIEKPASTIFLKVRGDSMQDEGIFQGDVVIVDKSLTPKVGEIIVAIVDNEYTLKYLMKDKSGKYYLKAANSKYKDIYPENELEVFGVVVGTFRKYK